MIIVLCSFQIGFSVKVLFFFVRKSEHPLCVCYKIPGKLQTYSDFGTRTRIAHAQKPVTNYPAMHAYVFYTLHYQKYQPIFFLDETNLKTTPMEQKETALAHFKITFFSNGYLFLCTLSKKIRISVTVFLFATIDSEKILQTVASDETKQENY